jgi:hypothetical protein
MMNKSKVHRVKAAKVQNVEFMRALPSKLPPIKFNLPDESTKPGPGASTVWGKVLFEKKVLSLAPRVSGGTPNFPDLNLSPLIISAH